VDLPNGSGRLLFVHKGTLFAAPFDPTTLAPAGDAVPVMDDTQYNLAVGASYAVSKNGALVYLHGGPGAAGLLRIVWVDATGRREPIHATPGNYFTPRLSPDDKRLAFSQGTSSGFQIWVKDVERDTLSRLDFLPGSNQWPTWTPDGRHIVFRSLDHPAKGLYWVRADGAGGVHRLTDGSTDQVPYSISPDGKRLAFSMLGDGAYDVATAVLEGDPDRPTLGKPEIFVGTGAIESYPAFSPDGRWMAYMSDETGTPEIYVRPFGRPGGRWQISAGRGTFPYWSKDGQILYRGGEQGIMAVSYSARGESFIHGKPRVWSPVLLPPLGTGSTWHIASDGKRGVAILPGEEGLPPPKLSFLMNFLDEVQRRTSK
jgi:serine/threonine-protein kinase